MRNTKAKVYFTLIAPVYNVAPYLQTFIESVINQTFIDFELLLINDGSTDNSLEICQRYGDQDRRIAVFTKKNTGVSDTRNYGIEKARGEYTLFLDSDDYISESLLQKLSKLTITKTADIFIYNFYIIKNDLKYPHAFAENFQKSGFIEIEDLYESLATSKGVQGFVWNKLFRTDLIKTIRFETEIHYLEDVVFNVEVVKNAKSIYWLPEALYYYRQREGSAVSTFSEKQLSYLDAVDVLVKRIPEKFRVDFELKKSVALINFARKTVFKNRSLYKKLKKDFKDGVNDIDYKNSHLKKVDKMMISISKKHFGLGVVMMGIKYKIVSSSIYYRFKG